MGAPILRIIFKLIEKGMQNTQRMVYHSGNGNNFKKLSYYAAVHSFSFLSSPIFRREVYVP